MKTIFEKIIDDEITSEKVFENEHVIAIKDIAPQAPIHLLIITKKVIPSLQEMKKEDYFLLGEIVDAAKILAKQFNLMPEGYRLVTNIGPFGGQIIFHLHFHLLGGEALGRLG